MQLRGIPIVGARHPRRWLIAMILVVLLRSAAAAADPAAEATPAPSIHGEFTIGKGGRLIILPIKLGNQTVLAMMDTGASLSAFDVSLKTFLGEPLGARVLQTPGSRKRVETYGWPKVTLGNQTLNIAKPAVCLDLEEVRQASNVKIRAIIGMDVLGTSRLQIDFDRGQLQFLESLPEQRDGLGQKIPMELAEDGAPFVVGSIGGSITERFCIDTGAQGNSLNDRVFDELVERNLIRLGSSFANVSIAGLSRGERGRLDKLSIGPFTHDALRVSRVTVSSLGLRYFSRFRVTFDFPGKCVYLKPGAQFTRSEPQATSGLVLKWLDGEVVVIAVKKDGPGDAAGVAPRDVLVRINGRDATQYDHFALRELLTSEGGKRVPITIRRMGRQIDMEVVLDQD